MGDVRPWMEMAGDVPVVRAPEEIDITNADGLHETLVEAAAYGHGTFVVDMTGTRFCDSSGLHVLTRTARRHRREPRGIPIAGDRTTREHRIVALY